MSEKLSEHDEALKNKIVEHCRWMWKNDREYASWAFNNYAKMLPWLNLEKKNDSRTQS